MKKSHYSLVIVALLVCVGFFKSTDAVAIPIDVLNLDSNAVFTLSLFKIDDEMTATIFNDSLPTGEIFAQQGFGAGPFAYDFTHLVDSGLNRINLSLYNGPSGYTLGWSVLVDGESIASFDCGVYNTFGCDNDAYTQGIAYTTDIEFNNVTSAVPVPAAVWLFGSGLLGLIGIAKKKAA
jgi:hypothetical protein